MPSTPMRLRDIRRLRPVWQAPAYSGWVSIWTCGSGSYWMPEYQTVDSLQRLLDRAISDKGPDFVPDPNFFRTFVRKEAKNGKSAPGESGGGHALDGGPQASGIAEPADSGESVTDGHGRIARHHGSEASSCESAPTRGHGEEPHEDEQDPSLPGADESAPRSPGGRQVMEACREEGTDPGTDSGPREDGDGEGASVERHSACREYGGQTATRADAMRLVDALTGEARECYRQLNRVIRDRVGGTDDDSPRIDGGKLVREILTRRCSVARATKQASELPRVLLAADVSGSCSSASKDTLAACYAVAATIPSVTVVCHSNGVVIPEDSLPRVSEETLKDVALRIRPAFTLFFGDGHAYDALVALARMGRLVWLDSYLSRRLDVPRRDYCPIQCEYWVGVNSAARAASVLRLL